MNNPSTPISCPVYDLLEMAAMKRRQLIFTIAGMKQEHLIPRKTNRTSTFFYQAFIV
jgi:transcriptional antiterminator Rof (Rho-off)